MLDSHVSSKPTILYMTQFPSRISHFQLFVYSFSFCRYCSLSCSTLYGILQPRKADEMPYFFAFHSFSQPSIHCGETP